MKPFRLVSAQLVLLGLVAVAGCDPDVPDVAAPPQADGPRAIVVAVDAMNEEILRRTVPEERAPALLAYFDEASCAAHAVSHFPSVTAASLATLWTGAYGEVTGVTANNHHALPGDQHTVMDRVRGFGHEGLMAEPLWVTGGREGVAVAGHHVTQAPGVPGFPPVTSADALANDEPPRRRAAAVAMAEPHVTVMNGYNVLVEPHRVLGPGDVTFGDLDGWAGIDELNTGAPPLAFSWETGAGTFHGLVWGPGQAYDRVLVNRTPSVAGAVTAVAAEVESEAVRGRELARHFSGAVAVPVDGGQVHLRARLFEVAPDGSDFLLYHPSLHVVEANHAHDQRAYEDAVRGWLGNSALSVYGSGRLGPTVAQGGDGTAEARLLETAELMTRQFMRGSEWIWTERAPRLLLDYFPLGDEADHNFYGYLDEAWPGYDAATAGRMGDIRARMWELVDLRVEHLEGLAREADAALFIAGDHGIRATWRQFLPNAALREAGLLTLDADGEVDLARTRAVSPNGYWVSVNRQAWREGIVPPQEEAQVVAAARQALEGLRGPEGEPVVTRTFTPDEAPEMGLGGPAGGDLYWATAPGYRWSWRYDGPAVIEAGPWGSHGFPPDEPDMFTVFCAAGSDFPGVRTGPVRITAVAPTVAEYVGLGAPRESVGTSVLSALVGRWPQ